MPWHTEASTETMFVSTVKRYTNVLNIQVSPNKSLSLFPFSFSLPPTLSLYLHNVAPTVKCVVQKYTKGLNIAVSSNKSLSLFPLEHYARTVKRYTNGLNIAVSPKKTLSFSLLFLSPSCSLSLFAQCGTRSEVCCQKIYQGKGLNIDLICEVPKYETLKGMHQWCGEIRLFGVRGGCWKISSGRKRRLLEIMFIVSEAHETLTSQGLIK